MVKGMQRYVTGNAKVSCRECKDMVKGVQRYDTGSAKV